MISRLIFSRTTLRLTAALAAPVFAALLLQATLLDSGEEEKATRVPLDGVRVHRARQLDVLLNSAGYEWPPSGAIPRVGVRRLPGDLGELPPQERKRLFFRALLPLVVAENERIEKQRQLLLELFANGPLALESEGYRMATRLAQEYRVSGDLNTPSTRDLLLRRVDTIPVPLALAQAATESAWGTSRFAREGNSLFGQWTWVRGAGLTPLNRAPGKGHLVRSFPDLRAGVRAYFLNLNAGHAYGQFRRARAQMRQAGSPFDPLVLAGGLVRYSERGALYVEEIRSFMRDNNLLALEGVTLRPANR